MDAADRYISRFTKAAKKPSRPKKKARPRYRPPRLSPEEERRSIYKARNEVLRSLGFASYADYLRSPLWASIRQRVLESSRWCFVCGDLATQVHHQRYCRKDLTGKSLKKLVPVCATHHYRAEFRRHDGAKLSTRQANRKLKQLRTLERFAAAARERLATKRNLHSTSEDRRLAVEGIRRFMSTTDPG